MSAAAAHFEFLLWTKHDYIKGKDPDIICVELINICVGGGRNRKDVCRYKKLPYRWQQRDGGIRSDEHRWSVHFLLCCYWYSLTHSLFLISQFLIFNPIYISGIKCFSTLNRHWSNIYHMVIMTYICDWLQAPFLDLLWTITREWRHPCQTSWCRSWWWLCWLH